MDEVGYITSKLVSIIEYLFLSCKHFLKLVGKDIYVTLIFFSAVVSIGSFFGFALWIS